MSSLDKLKDLISSKTGKVGQCYRCSRVAKLYKNKNENYVCYKCKGKQK